jgi:hypothetical protein
MLSVLGEATNGVTMEASVMGELDRSCIVTDHPLRSFPSVCMADLRRSLLVRHPNLQVNMGCFMQSNFGRKYVVHLFLGFSSAAWRAEDHIEAKIHVRSSFFVL